MSIARSNPADLSVLEAAAELREGRLTSAELVEAHLDRIAARNGDLRAFVEVLTDSARREAERADRELRDGIDRGPLHGIPIGIKDVIDVSGVRTAAGSRLRSDHIAGADAEVVSRLRSGGALPIGKLTTYEFATVGPDFNALSPPARNPWARDRITGGSSSGNAAAVAGGLLRTSVGTDTAGSLRGPASYCGVVGLKPTLGVVPTTGIFPLSMSLDHVGPIAATVAEAAVTLDVLSGRQDEQSTGRSLKRGVGGLRIAYARDWFANDPGTLPEVTAAVDEAASVLSLLGARITEVTLPAYDVLEQVGSIILNAESYALHSADLDSRAAEYGSMSRKSLLTGAGLSARDLEHARATGAELTRQMDEVFADADAILTVTTLTPALPLSAFAGGRTVWTPMRTIGFNVTGHPVLSVPAGFVDGLPIGIQIAGRRGDEAVIVRVGHAFEQATDHSTVRPALPHPALAEPVA